MHSPFAFNLITKVIEEKSAFYIFETIEEIRSDLLKDNSTVSFLTQKGKIKEKTIAQIVEKECKNQKYCSLLFRIINFFLCKDILEIGGSIGIMGLYLSSASSKCRCISLERRSVLAQKSNELIDRLGTKSLEVSSGDYMQQIKELLDKNKTMDFIFINTSYDAKLCAAIIEECLKLRHEKTVLVIDGILKNKKMKGVWNDICSRNCTRLSIDLHSLGLIFFDKKVHKQHLTTFFDDGKKQNIYKRGRQGLDFFSWRKESFKSSVQIRGLWKR
ncbi:O-methyltransferase [Bacteroidales bacterium]|nr:O-methyltransferase [Bacteroidales bacterium]